MEPRAGVNHKAASRTIIVSQRNSVDAVPWTRVYSKKLSGMHAELGTCGFWGGLKSRLSFLKARLSKKKRKRKFTTLHHSSLDEWSLATHLKLILVGQRSAGHVDRDLPLVRPEHQGLPRVDQVPVDPVLVHVDGSQPAVVDQPAGLDVDGRLPPSFVALWTDGRNVYLPTFLSQQLK